MSKRFFTADFHLGMEILLNKDVMGNDVRPFQTIQQMNSVLIQNCNAKACIYKRSIPALDISGNQRFSYICKVNEHGKMILDKNNNPIVIKKMIYDDIIVDKDIIIHVGDLACFNSGKENLELEMRPQQFIQQIHANFINIRGNHDVNNKVKSVCTCMQTNLGKRFPNVTIGHYPSYDIHAKGTFKDGWIHLCGHVHKKWKHCLDVQHSVLNINVGVDVWDYQIVSEEELVKYIDKVLKMPKEKLIRK